MQGRGRIQAQLQMHKKIVYLNQSSVGLRFVQLRKSVDNFKKLLKSTRKFKNRNLRRVQLFQIQFLCSKTIIILRHLYRYHFKTSNRLILTYKHLVIQHPNLDFILMIKQTLIYWLSFDFHVWIYISQGSCKCCFHFARRSSWNWSAAKWIPGCCRQ